MTTLKLNDTNDNLKKLASTHNINRVSLAKLLDVSHSTVDKWYGDKNKDHYRKVPLSTLELLRLQVYVCKTVPLTDLILNSPVNCNAMKQAGLIA